MRLILKKCSALSFCFVQVNRTSIRNVWKARQVELNQDTLTGRILLYLNPEYEKTSNSVANKVPTFHNDVNNLGKLSTSAIIQILNRYSTSNKSSNKLLDFITNVDKELCARSNKIKPDDTFQLLNLYMQYIHNQITYTSFYKQSIRELYKSVHNLSGKHLVQFIFYLALQKKQHESQKMLRHCFAFRFDKNFIDSLTIEELCIICNATFKASTKIKSKLFLDKVKACVNENMSVMKDPALFVTLVKTLRHNRCQDEDLLGTVSCGIIFNKAYELYTFPALCHILALYADFYYYDERLFELFVKQCLKQLEETKFVSRRVNLLEQMRGKDITRFLWITSLFNEFKLLTKENLEQIIVPKLAERIAGGEFQQDVDSLIDATLYIWMLDYKPYQLLPHVITAKTISKMRPKSKSALRLNLLLEAIQLEDNEYYQALPIQEVSVPSNFEYQSQRQLEERPVLNRLLQTLVSIKRDVRLDRFEITQEIEHISFVGVTGFRGDEKVVFIEILDGFTCVKNVEDSIPNGVLSLKLRLLECRKEGLLVIDEKEVEDMTEPEFEEYLKDELMLIC